MKLTVVLDVHRLVERLRLNRSRCVIVSFGYMRSIRFIDSVISVLLMRKARESCLWYVISIKMA